jgi:hypothetical protein
MVDRAENEASCRGSPGALLHQGLWVPNSVRAATCVYSAGGTPRLDQPAGGQGSRRASGKDRLSGPTRSHHDRLVACRLRSVETALPRVDPGRLATGRRVHRSRSRKTLRGVEQPAHLAPG